MRYVENKKTGWNPTLPFVGSATTTEYKCLLSSLLRRQQYAEHTTVGVQRGWRCRYVKAPQTQWIVCGVHKTRGSLCCTNFGQEKN